RIASLRDIERSDAVLVLGEDVMNVAPRMALSLRQSTRQAPMEVARKKGVPLWQDDAVREAVQDQKGPLYVATPGTTRLDSLATEVLRETPDAIARLGFAIAHVLDPAAPEVPNLSPDTAGLADRIAQALRGAKRPLIVSGASCRSEAIIQAAANVAWALAKTSPQTAISFTSAESNTMGLAMMDA